MIRPLLAVLILCAAGQTLAQPLPGGPDAIPAAPERSVSPDREPRSGTVILAPALRDDGGPARACTARVVGLRPLSHYDHAQGSGFLAVRAGPGSTFPQIGELYLGDSVVVGDRRGNWYAVRCSSGLCATPLWGEADPEGWAYGRFLHLDCPG